LECEAVITSSKDVLSPRSLDREFDFYLTEQLDTLAGLTGMQHVSLDVPPELETDIVSIESAQKAEHKRNRKPFVPKATLQFKDKSPAERSPDKSHHWIPNANCKNYLRHNCKKGSRCTFLHDPSVFLKDTQKVFLGGFPDFMRTMSPEQIVGEFKAVGYNIINTPRMHPKGFIAKVTLATEEEAQRMMANKVIVFDSFKQHGPVKIDVRPYTDKKGNTSEHRALVFTNLGPDMTAEQLDDFLFSNGWLVRSIGVVVNGVAPKVEMETVDAADCLATLEAMKIGERMVRLIPFLGEITKKIKPGMQRASPNGSLQKRYMGQLRRGTPRVQHAQASRSFGRVAAPSRWVKSNALKPVSAGRFAQVW